MSQYTKFNFNTNQIQISTKEVKHFPDNNTAESSFAKVSLFDNHHNKLGQLVSNVSAITSHENVDNCNTVYYITLTSTIFVNSIGTITYSYSTTSSNKYIFTPPGTTLVCKIVYGTEKYLNVTGNVIINYFEGGNTEILVDA